MDFYKHLACVRHCAGHQGDEDEHDTGLASKELTVEWKSDPGGEEYELLKGKDQVFLNFVSLAAHPSCLLSSLLNEWVNKWDCDGHGAREWSKE